MNLEPIIRPDGKLMRDELTFRPLVVVWSMSESKEPPQHLEMTVNSMQIVSQEAVLWHRRELEEHRYERLMR